MIRKTLSVSTFGVIRFRSTKEQLRRAERARWGAEKDLEREHAARVAAESRVTAAERRLERASDAAQHVAQRLERSKAKRREQRAARVRTVLDGAEPAGRRARAVAKRSAADARRGAKRTLRRARAVAESTKDAVAPPVERAVARASEAIESISS